MPECGTSNDDQHSQPNQNPEQHRDLTLPVWIAYGNRTSGQNTVPLAEFLPHAGSYGATFVPIRGEAIISSCAVTIRSREARNPRLWSICGSISSKLLEM